MAENEVTVEYDLDGKLLQIQYVSAKTLRGEVVNDFLQTAKSKGVELPLAKGMRRDALRLKQSDKPTNKWLITLHLSATKTGEGSDEHYDFTGSEAFYAWLKKEGEKSESKAKLRLVYDECSDSRADVLYPIIKDIEHRFRVLALKLGLPLGNNVRNLSTGEHLICNVDTSELFGVYFMRHASQKYFLEQLAKAATDEEREAARHLTIADEIGFSEFKDFLEKIHVIRNPVMHGRYITEQKFQSSLETLKKIRETLQNKEVYERIVINEELMKSIAEMAKSMSNFVAEMTGLAQTVAPLVRSISEIQKSFLPTIEASRLLSAQMAPMMSAFQGPNGILSNIQKTMMPQLQVPLPKFPITPMPVIMNNMPTKITIKRAYDEPGKDDGYRVLVDRLWPRGVKKEALAIDEWDKDIAPSPELRKWFGHDPTKFDEFRARYTTELESSDEPQKLLEKAGKHTVITLVYAAKDPEINHARVLQEYLQSRV